MSDFADFEDFIIKYTALVVFKALLCLFFSVFQCLISESEYIQVYSGLFVYTLSLIEVYFTLSDSLFDKNVRIKAL